MTQQTKTYDSKKIAIIVNGLPLSGFSESTLVKVTRSADTWKKTVSADGMVTRSKENDLSGEITFSLLQTSQSNDALSAIALLDELKSGGIVPVLIKDLNGTSLYTAAEAWVKKPPEGGAEKDAKDRSWVLECSQLIWFVGGN
jgi:hypothetical protein